MNLYYESQLVHTDGYRVGYEAATSPNFGDPHQLRPFGGFAEDGRGAAMPDAPTCLVARGHATRAWTPTPSQSLHLEFERTSPTPEGFAEFAAKYGLLSPPIDRLRQMETWHELEPLSRWETTWKSVHFALRAIRVAHRQHEEQSLADRLVTINGDWFWYQDQSPHGAVRRSFPQDPRRPLLENIFEGERRRAVALWFAQDMTNAWLSEYAPLQLQLDQDAGPDDSPREVIRPLSLSGLIWTHIARHIAGAAVLATCDECRQMFEPTRADAKYCSDACRQKSYRRRQTAARED